MMSSSSSSSPPEEESMGSSGFSSFLNLLSSYNSYILSAALLSLLLVILFVFLLHFYARFFFSASHETLRHRRRRRVRRTVTTARIIPSVSITEFSASPLESITVDKGLDSSSISSLPLFIYEEGDDNDNEGEEEEECVICLGLWEVGDVGRKLSKCEHGFHVECIDMWLSSHSTCPLCRVPVLATHEDNPKPLSDVDNTSFNGVGAMELEQELVQVVVSDGNEDSGGDGSTPETGERDQRMSSSCLFCANRVLETESNLKPLDNGVLGSEGGEEEAVVDVFSGGERRSPSSSSVWNGECSTSGCSSSLKRMMSSRSRSERNNKVFPAVADKRFI